MNDGWIEPSNHDHIDRLEIVLDESLPPDMVKPVFTTIEQIKLDIPAYIKVGKNVYEQILILKKIPKKEGQ